MRLFLFPILAGLGWCTTLAPAGDLAKIDRTLGKEPAYQSKPRYCLLVFGPEARFRVWLAFDGDTVYVDRNGNGDLAEPGERLEPAKKLPDSAFVRSRSYEAGPFRDPTTGK